MRRANLLFRPASETMPYGVDWCSKHTSLPSLSSFCASAKVHDIT